MADAGAFQPPPDGELKVLTPFLQRAHETRKADPALAYWCNYHAAQLGISRASKLPPASRAYLLSLMDTLEQQKKSLAGNDIVHGDELVAKAHIENVALKVFGGADNEDRTGKATRATARRFLVAGNFIEVLTNFGALDTEMEEKLKYAKWKAADIARAFREGRQPTPGPAGGLEEEEQTKNEQGEQDTAVNGLEAAAARLGGLSADTGALPSKEELDAEMAKLTAQEGGADEHDNGAGAVAISSPHMQSATLDQPFDDATTSGSHRRRAQSRLSYDGRIAGGIEGFSEIEGGVTPPISNSSSPNFSKPMHITRTASQGSNILHNHSRAGTPSDGNVSGDTQSAFFQYTQGRIPSSGAASPHNRPLPHPPGMSGDGRSTLPVPPLAPGSLANNFGSPPNDQSPATTPKEVQGIVPSRPPQQYSSAVPSAPPAPAALAPPSHEPVAAMPAILTLAQTARVQKLAKWAVSALDYEDLATARKQLREALDICEGRTPSSTYVSK